MNEEPNTHQRPRVITVPSPIDLRATVAPTAWSKGRWPDTDWIDGTLVWVGREHGITCYRSVRQLDRTSLEINGDADSTLDRPWLADVLGIETVLPVYVNAVLSELLAELPGLYPSSSGSLFEGIICCIAGQSITVAAAATVQRRLYGLFDNGIEIDCRRFFPAPSPADVAEAPIALVRSTGVTWRRAEAIVAAAKAQIAGALPSDDTARSNPELARAAMRELPLVGKWTCESALLWGLGTMDAFPTGDVALLRAIRRRYSDPDLTMKDLDRLSESWQPARGYAARLFWTDLLGKAP